MKRIFACYILIMMISLVGCTPQETEPALPDSSEVPTESSSSEVTQESSSSEVSSEPPAVSEDDTSTTGTLKAELDVDLTQLESFKYEKLSAQEVEELLLTGEDALAAAESLMAFHVSDVDSPNTDPVVGGAKQYTLTFSGGEVLVIYDNGMLGINDQKDFYQREGKEEITIPENAQWVKYAVDLFTGEKTPVS